MSSSNLATSTKAASIYFNPSSQAIPFTKSSIMPFRAEGPYDVSTALCVCFLIPLNITIFIMVVAVPWFVINIDQMYGEPMDQLRFSYSRNYLNSDNDNLLEIRCYFDRFKFGGLLIDDPYVTSIKTLEDPIPVDSSTCNWKWDLEPTDWDHGNKCRVFFKDIKGPEECIPQGFRSVFAGQGWYNEDDGSCNVSFERDAGQGALAMSILGLLSVFPAFFLFTGTGSVAGFISTGLCMVSLLACVIPFGKENICAQQGSDANHLALLSLVSCSAFCCLYIGFWGIVSKLRFEN